MADKNFFKDNFVMIVGLALPVVLMVGFMLASSLPPSGDPPKYDVIFSSPDYSSSGKPVTVTLVVKDGTLKAQYTKVPNPQTYPNNQWVKLYQFDAKTQTVRALGFGLPDEVDSITGTREDTVDATKNLKLDTSLKAPDGFELTNEYYRHGGLMGDLFGGWNSSSEMRLRNGSKTVRLTGDGAPFYYGSATFIGWVKE